MANLLELWWNWRHRKYRARPAPPPPPPPVPPQPFVAAGCCARCGFHSANNDAWPEQTPEPLPQGYCRIRGFDVARPLTTYCKNFASRSGQLHGATYSILPGGVAVPWFGLDAPQTAAGTCVVCGAEVTEGLGLEVYEGAVCTCGVEHYYAWWAGYLEQRLAFFKRQAEGAYDAMYETARPTGSYSDSKEAYYSAIGTARDLEYTDEQHALEQRLGHVKAVFRSQFT